MTDNERNELALRVHDFPAIKHKRDDLTCYHCGSTRWRAKTIIADYRKRKHYRVIEVMTCLTCDGPTHPDLVAMGDDGPYFPTHEEPFL